MSDYNKQRETTKDYKYSRYIKQIAYPNLCKGKKTEGKGQKIELDYLYNTWNIGVSGKGEHIYIYIYTYDETKHEGRARRRFTCSTRVGECRTS